MKKLRSILLAAIIVCSMLFAVNTQNTFSAHAQTHNKNIDELSINLYQTRSELLMSATDYVGVFTPKQAATVWATGLINRSAAMQYVVMTESLKELYAGQLGDSNWVTGESSPWISSYEITKLENPNDTHAEVNILFETLSAGVPYKEYHAKLWLVKENDFWRIEKIQTDKDLNIFTGFSPSM